MNLFINYFRCATRPTCLNLAMARLILCVYGIWKTLSYPYASTAYFPNEMFGGELYASLSYLRPPPAHWIVLEQALAAGSLLLCAAGFKRGTSAMCAAMMLTHMEGFAHAVENEKTATNLAFFLIFYGMFRDSDTLSWDGWLAARKRSRPELSGELRTALTPVTLDALKWFLVTLAGIYFFAGFGKWRESGWGFSWASGENIRLSLLTCATQLTLPVAPIGEFLCRHPTALSLAGYGTMLLELGFLLAVLAGLPITPFIAGLAGMHWVILQAMNINYFADMGFLYLAFVAWDDLAARLQRSRRLLVVYDENDPRWMSILLLFRRSDVTGGLRFVASCDETAPQPSGNGIGMRVIDEMGREACGYDGVVALLAYQGLTRPLAWLLSIPPVAASVRMALWATGHRPRSRGR